ncbi:MAG: tetratricopeptide repeat protein [Planctomycetota bacterium]|jgi:tetratricopeptide (TPR) repeat protein
MGAKARISVWALGTRDEPIGGRGVLLAAVAILSGWLVAPVAAHPGLHHDIERLTSALAEEPGRAGLWIKRAHHYRLDGRFSEALADLDRARVLDAGKLEICLHRGLTLSAMGRDAEAEAELSWFLQHGAGGVAAFAERARIRQRSGRSELALSDYSAAIALNRDVDLYLARGKLQESLGLLDEAAEGYRDGLASLGGGATIRSSLVRVEISRQRYDAALALIDEVLRRAPVKTEQYLLRAEVLEASGQSDQARVERERALVEADRVFRKRATALHLLSRAKVNLALGNMNDAMGDLKWALKKSPRFARARRLLERLEAQHACEKQGAF